METPAKVGIFLVLLIVLVGAVTGGIKVWSSYTNGLIEEGRKNGEASCDAAYKARDNEKLQKVIAELAAATIAKEAAELKARQMTSTFETQLEEKKLENAKLASANRILTGERRVRESAFVQTGGGCSGSGGQAETKTPTATASNNERASCDLSPGTKQSLRTIGLRANEAALQLKACQQLLVYDRQFCNGQ